MLWLLIACDDTIFPTPPGGEVVSGDTIEDVKKVIEGDCLSCHSAAAALGGLDLETDFCAAVVGVASDGYGASLVSPGDHLGSVLWNKMDDTGTYGGVMPQSGKLAQSSVDTVAAWIDKGASCSSEDTGGASDDSGEPPRYTYQMVQETVFDATCTGCHIAGGSAEFLPLDSAHAYNAIVGVDSFGMPDLKLVEPEYPENSYLMRKMVGMGIVGDRMPQGGQVDPQQIAMVYGWIFEGAPR